VSTPYRLSFTTGGLFITEAPVVVACYLTHLDWTQARDQVRQDKLLQVRTDTAATRISKEIVARLEPILLAEPANQPEKWLTRKQGTANPQFLEALKNFMYWENYDVRVRMDGKIDKIVLADILSKRR